MTDTVKAYWLAFLRALDLPESTPCYDVFAFGIGEAMVTELLGLVLAGKKRATASALPACQAEGLAPPAPGDYSVVVDHAGNPACVIQTTAVAIQPFSAVRWEQAKREGEDENLAGWRANHIKYFTMEAEVLGFTFSEEMPVVFEDFDVVYR
ncbi:ASCH domain-containing protein [Ruminococcaceae bacterium OttesenSCG-928-A11]|nr:ASCH domain-containing protein [Ruminococcaceae bacterium OttesenSCG-928-A11]